MFCTHCGAEIDNNAAVCIHCGYAANQTPYVKDNINVGFVVLAVLIPLFGLIYWAIKYKETPKAAKACGIAAIISVALSLVLFVILFVIPF